MYRVLIADDEPKVSQLIKNLIQWEPLGLQLVGIANDGIKALEMIDMYRPDIVITDIRMPGFDGIELIKRAKMSHADIDFIIISGYQHFDYAHNAIKYNVKDYLLKPLKKQEINSTLQKIIEKYNREKAESSEKSELKKRLDEDMNRVKEAFIYNLYQCKDKVDLSQPLGVLNDIHHVLLDKKGFIAVEIKPDIDMYKNTEELRHILLEKLKDITRKQLGIYSESLLMNITDDSIQCIINESLERKKDLRRYLHQIIDGIQSQSDLFPNIKATVGVGSHQLELKNIYTSINEARLSVENRILLGSGQIIEYTQLQKSDHNIEDFLSVDLRQDLVRGTEALNKDTVNALILELETQIRNTTLLDSTFIRSIFDEVLNIVLFTLRQQLSTNHLENLIMKRYTNGLNMCNRLNTAFEWVRYIIEELITEILETKENEYLKPIQDAQTYIQNNYGNMIKLDDVSALVGFNPTYFSTLFKKETGISFLTYVTDIRMKEAKKKLSDLNKSITDVSYEVGYQDIKHFTKQFKKATGLTPSKYRKLYF